MFLVKQATPKTNTEYSKKSYLFTAQKPASNADKYKNFEFFVSLNLSIKNKEYKNPTVPKSIACEYGNVKLNKCGAQIPVAIVRHPNAKLNGFEKNLSAIK